VNSDFVKPVAQLLDLALQIQTLVITFTSESFCMAIMRNKKSSLPTPSTTERDAGIRRYMIVEDLTPANFQMLKLLKNMEEVDKIWTIKGKLRLKLKGHENIIKSKSVFDSVESFLDAAK
jgi:hypothetical protein